MLAVLCPGQGAQTPGFLEPWLALPGVAERLTHASDLLGLDLIGAGTHASAGQIRDTALAQPLIVASALAVAAELAALPAGTAVAGHSIGEVAATALAGVFDTGAALRFAQARGAAMADACARTPSGMTAVLGGDPDVVAAAVVAAGCVIANVNAAGQVVAAGTQECLDRLAEEPPAGARLRPLPVAGAFHTPLMASAEESLSDRATEFRTADPCAVLLSNADGSTVARGPDALRLLVRQVTRPVRWDRCMATLASLGVTVVVELPPAGTLSALARRELPGVTVVALKEPADLDQLKDPAAA
jgi:[acyl-carrier-protein] S-malonyltransferase